MRQTGANRFFDRWHFATIVHDEKRRKYVNTNISVSKLEKTKDARVDKMVKGSMNGYKLWLVCVCVCVEWMTK